MSENQNENQSPYFWNDDELQSRIKNSIPDGQSLKIVPPPKPKRSNRWMLQILSVALLGSILGSALTFGAFIFLGPDVLKGTGNTVYTNSGRKADVATSVDPKVVDSVANRTLTNEEIAEKVAPTVVGITNKSASTNPFSQDEVAVSSGSGIVLSADGYIMTNNHVIDGAQELTVSMVSGEEYPATVIGKDPHTDLAVIKINVTNLPYAILGDSSILKTGERVVAIGNPLIKELAGTVTVGVISAINRNMTVEGRQMTLLQTDAAISPGNSGGPLINAYGEVIGINSLKSTSYAVEGLGFAIPINDAKPIVDSLIQKGYVSRPAIGIAVTPVTQRLAQIYNLPEGLYIQSVTPFGSAERGGLKQGDVIIKCEDKSVKTADELNKIRDEHQIGDTLKFEVDRNSTIMTLDVVLLEDKSYAQNNNAQANSRANPNGGSQKNAG